MQKADNGPGLGPGLETKFCRFGDQIEIGEDLQIQGYASLFGVPDRGGDVVEPGAYGASLAALAARKAQVKMLWQHDPAQPIGVWDEIREDTKGLWVRGHLLDSIEKGREAAALIAAGALDGLSIGYRTKTATKGADGTRHLVEVELWEVSLVTFPMLPDARLGGKSDGAEKVLSQLADALRSARKAVHAKE